MASDYIGRDFLERFVSLNEVISGDLCQIVVAVATPMTVLIRLLCGPILARSSREEICAS